MPSKSYKPCAYPGCTNLTKTARCEQHSTQAQEQSRQDYDRHRRDKNSKKFYASAAWEKCRRYVLARDNHLCTQCLQRGRLTPATVVHHKHHLRGNKDRALDADNLESLCAKCHSKAHAQHAAAT